MQKMRIPDHLIEKIKKDAEANHRSATKQLEVVLTKVYWKKEVKADEDTK